MIAFALAMLLAAPAAAVPPPPDGPEPEVVETAPVVVDGVERFRVRGVASLAASDRARRISARIVDAARDGSLPIESLTTKPVELGLEIALGPRPLMVVGAPDAELAGVDATIVASLFSEQMRDAIVGFRGDRQPRALARSAGYAVLTAAILALVLFVLRRLFRGLESWLERRYGERIRSLRMRSFPVMDAERLLAMLRRTIRTLHLLLTLVSVFAAVQISLELFPWTRAVSRGLLSYVMDPLRRIGSGVLDYIPSLVFLVILVFVTRWALKLLKLFFNKIESGAIAFESFEADWASPTFRIVRILVLAFALVVAYPYLPGSDSGAFKGVSLFLGLMFSLGSSSAISNMIAGYSLTYRRAFKVGDVIRVDDHQGVVTAVRLLVTHIRTRTNEEVIVPNSTILGGNIVNFSSVARRDGLILHTNVGIGYEVPWRQVEAMLLLAAERTPGLRPEPKPFVLQTALGDFAVTYELNVYTENPAVMARTYADLHRNIQDVFNEYGIQIMTPAYEGDPAEPKVVPKERWHEAPAPPPAAGA
ncbi:MAG TPA: mechanosensitive ion channel family protein [Candidatus Polarisedimenticolaceae bacterium]